MLNLGIIGLGRHTITRLIPAIESSKKVSLRKILTTRLNRNHPLPTRQSIEICFEWGDFISGGLDIIVVASSNERHVDYICESLLCAPFVICEKPLVTSLDELHKVLEVLNQQKTGHLFESFPFLYHPVHKRLKEMILQDQLVGEIHLIASSFGVPRLSNDNFRLDPARGGGAFLDLACYPIRSFSDLVEEPVVLAAQVQRYGAMADSKGMAALSSSVGPVYCHAAWGFDLAYKNDIRVWGSKGLIEIDFYFSKPHDQKHIIRLTKKDQATEFIEFGFEDQFQIMFDLIADSDDEIFKKNCIENMIKYQQLFFRVKDKIEDTVF